jgi:hypothetical protein
MDPTPEPHEYRIYGDDRAQTWCVVDQIDYAYLVQWRWSWKVSRGGGKRYLRRTVQIGHKNYRVNGRTTVTLFLHTAIMERTGAQPSPEHVLVDHWDGDETNCLRDNLDWATHSMNGLNRFRVAKLPYGGQAGRLPAS